MEGYPAKRDWKRECKELEALVAQQAAVIEQMRQALQLCRSHMYCHASNTGDNAFDKLCSALTHQPCHA